MYVVSTCRVGYYNEQFLFPFPYSDQVYNETIRDLLLPSGTLKMRDDRGTLVVNGLSLHKVHTYSSDRLHTDTYVCMLPPLPLLHPQPHDANELLGMLEHGNKNRTQHPTEANATSSRSHAVFQVHIHQKPRTAGLSTEVRTAKLSLIDLAGSERATVTSNKGARMREGANINRSLLALGNCIIALASKKVGILKNI